MRIERVTLDLGDGATMKPNRARFEMGSPPTYRNRGNEALFCVPGINKEYAPC